MRLITGMARMRMFEFEIGAKKWFWMTQRARVVCAPNLCWARMPWVGAMRLCASAQCALARWCGRHRVGDTRSLGGVFGLEA